VLMNSVYFKIPAFSLYLFFVGYIVSLQVLASDDTAHITSFLQDTNFKVGKTYTNGFENIADFASFYIIPQNHRGSSSHDLVTDIKHSGNRAHKAWMYGVNDVIANDNTNHRAYPAFQMNKTELGIIKSKVLVDFWVWFDVDLHAEEHKNWLSLATFTSYADTNWIRSYLVNVDNDYRIHLMHVPQQGLSSQNIYPNQTTQLPKKQWVKLSIFIDYTKDNRFSSPFIGVWQDSILVAASTFNDRIDPYSILPERHPQCLQGWDQRDLTDAEQRCGLNYTGGLAQLHLGLYAPPLLSTGTIYNDELRIFEILRNDLQ
jgi:hypothetical protein